MSKPTLNLALIGAGRIGRIHAENLATHIPRTRLAAVADIDLAAARELGRRFRVPTITRDYRELLTDASLDAVVVCSATTTHARIIQEAAAAGKHIFCEKPIDLDLKQIQRSLAAVETAGVKFQVGFNRRFDPSFARAKAMIAEGKIGTPHLLRITSRDPAPPPLEYVRVSGGIFLDMTIHDFDMTRYLTGSEAVEIYAVGQALIDPHVGELGDVDTCIVTLRLANGMLATIDNSRQAVYGYDQRVEVFGTKGMVAVSNRTPDDHFFVDAEGVHSPKPEYFFLERYREAYLAELRAFVGCLRNEAAPAVTGLDGLMPVLMGLAAGQSLRERRPVSLRENPFFIPKPLAQPTGNSPHAGA